MAVAIVVCSVISAFPVGRLASDSGPVPPRPPASTKPVARSSLRASVTTTPAAAIQPRTANGYPPPSRTIPDPIPPSGVDVEDADVILRPPSVSRPRVSEQDAIHDAQWGTADVHAVLADMSIPGTEDLAPVAYIDGQRTYPRISGIEVWVVSFKYPQPELVCQGGNLVRTKVPPTCVVDYGATAIDASNGDFVRGFFYGAVGSG